MVFLDRLCKPSSGLSVTHQLMAKHCEYAGPVVDILFPVQRDLP